MITLNGKTIEVTRFPDGTSQVWKLDIPSAPWDIVWEFADEGEIVSLWQLNTLLLSTIKTGDEASYPSLHMPFLPYGRQDKRVWSSNTFGLHSFYHMLMAMSFRRITTLDAHSDFDGSLGWGSGPDNLAPRVVHNIEPNKEIIYALIGCNPDLIIFPDNGASTRYGNMVCLDGYKTKYCDKVRDSTGRITELNFIAEEEITGATCLIVDDICDGGMTFILCAKELYDNGANEVYLYTTHGIYSKGLDVLKEAGIKKVFNRDGREDDWD